MNHHLVHSYRQGLVSVPPFWYLTSALLCILQTKMQRQRQSAAHLNVENNFIDYSVGHFSRCSHRHFMKFFKI